MGLKKMISRILIAKLLVLLTGGICFGQDAMTEVRPRMVVAGDRHEFQTVPEGTRIDHTFMIMNEGDGPLSIESVTQSCSCMTVLSYDKTILPHTRGGISIRLDTTGYGGQEMDRTLVVKSSEPGRPPVKLTVTGKVETVYTMTPKVAKLEGNAGDKIGVSVTVIPEPNYPFKVLTSQAKSGEFIQFRVEEILLEGRPAFRLQINNKRTEEGRYFDSISLTTDSQAASTIRVGVFGHIKGSG
jgi:hypothetical protein